MEPTGWTLGGALAIWPLLYFHPELPQPPAPLVSGRAPLPAGTDERACAAWFGADEPMGAPPVSFDVLMRALLQTAFFADVLEQALPMPYMWVRLLRSTFGGASSEPQQESSDRDILDAHVRVAEKLLNGINPGEKPVSLKATASDAWIRCTKVLLVSSSALHVVGRSGTWWSAAAARRGVLMTK